MEFERNEKLTQEDRQELIKGLTEVAQLYFNENYIQYDTLGINASANPLSITNGICSALSNLGYGGYYLIEELEVEMDNRYDSYHCITSPEGWEPRAYMCLFLVEYLKDTI